MCIFQYLYVYLYVYVHMGKGPIANSFGRDDCSPVRSKLSED